MKKHLKLLTEPKVAKAQTDPRPLSEKLSLLMGVLTAAVTFSDAKAIADDG